MMDGVSSTGRNSGRGVITGGGYLHLPPPEHSHTVHFNQAHYGPVSGDEAAAGIKGGQSVVGSGRLGIGEDAGGSSGGYKDGGGGVYGWGGDGYRLHMWEDTLANTILGMEPNDTIDCDPRLELKHLLMSMLGGT